MSLEEQVRQVAIHEVLHHTFLLTQQYLQVNRILQHDHTPHIEEVVMRDDRQSALVYFPIEGADFKTPDKCHRF